MANLYQYKCPACGGALAFDSDAQQVKCPFCDSLFPVSDFLAADAALENGPEGPDGQTLESVNGAESEEASGLYVFTCSSCGGEIIGDEHMAATSCPYCGNPVIISGNFSGSLKPAYVIPFQFNKEEAKNKLADHFRGRKFLPKEFSSENHLDEIKGLYVPYWLYDTDVIGQANFEGTKVRSWSDSRYDYTETSYYDIHTEGGLEMEHLPADGSSKMDDTMMESLEPFPFNLATDFQTAYLAGFLADKYDVTYQQNLPRVRVRALNSLISRLRAQVRGYHSVSTRSASGDLYHLSVHYALYPVWLMNTTWRGKQYTFAMNGATGKMVGDLPCDKKKAFWKTVSNFLIWGAAASVIVFLILTYLA